MALVSLPREEEPQISVPVIDLHLQAKGPRADDAVKLVTEPLGVIFKGINDVGHVYSSTRDNAAMVTARFKVGTRPKDAILRVRDKLRANMGAIPMGIPEPLVNGRGIDEVAILAVTLAIARRAGANAVVLAQDVLARVEALTPKLIPDGVSITVPHDYGETANERANELLFHLGLASVSIIILVFFAIGGREATVVAIVIPATILLTLFAAWVMGYSLNRVSLFALIFSIGILVDDAIFVIESIDRHWGMDRKKSRVQAAIDAVAEVANPTIVATLTWLRRCCRCCSFLG